MQINLYSTLIIKINTQKNNYDVLLHSTQQHIQCSKCRGQYRIHNCRRLNVPDIWKQIMKIDDHFSCLNIRQITQDCKRVCPEEGCQHKHNKLLHVLSCTSKDNTKKFRAHILPHGSLRLLRWWIIHHHNCRKNMS